MASELLRYLFTLTLASGVAILIVLLARHGLRRMFGAGAAYLSWLLVVVAVATVFLPHSAARSPWDLVLETDPASALRHVVYRALGRSPGTDSSLQWQADLLVAWCLGAVLFVVYLAAAQRAFVRSLGTLAGSRRVVRAERAAGSPALLGVIRPKIVLPTDFESRYTRLERLLIFSHERTHLHRGDAGWNALVSALRCLLWFNPLVHLAATCFRVDQELACDAAVIREHPGLQRSYARAILKTELASAELPVGCTWRSVHDFRQRLALLARAIPGRTRRVCGLVCVTLASLTVGYAVWATEPIVINQPLTTREQQHKYTGQPVTFNFIHIETRAVLQLLADASGRKIIASDSVTGSISMHLVNVPWDQVLDIVVKAEGLEMRHDGNMIRVAPAVEQSAHKARR